MIPYDFHLHSTASDGKLTPFELIKKAKKRKMKAIALTDHDTIRGLEDFLKKCRKNGLISLGGLEISTKMENFKLHILGYNINFKNQNLLRALKDQRKEREIRLRKIVNKLKKAGFQIEFNEVVKKNSQRSLGRSHIARVILEKKRNRGLIKNLFGKILNEYELVSQFMDKSGQIGYVEKKRIPAFSAISLIHQAKGVAVLAHPGKDIKEKKDLLVILDKLVKNRLDGLEVYTPYHTPYLTPFYKEISQKYNLLQTCGSDDHGLNDFRRMGGIELFNQDPKELFKRLEKTFPSLF